MAAEILCHSTLFFTSSCRAQHPALPFIASCHQAQHPVLFCRIYSQLARRHFVITVYSGQFSTYRVRFLIHDMRSISCF